MNKNNYLLSIIFPAYNEEKNLALLVPEIKKYLNDSDIEIVIVENGSADNSKKLLKDQENQIDNLKVVYLDKNKGYGRGILRGLNEAKGKYIGYAHADMQYHPKDLFKVKDILIKNKKNNLFIKGTRKGRGIVDAVFTFGMSILETLIFNKFLWDINAQPNIFHKSFLNKIENPPDNFLFDLYVYIVAKKNNNKIVRYPINFPKRIYGESKWNFNFFSRINFAIKIIKYSLKLKKIF